MRSPARTESNGFSARKCIGQSIVTCLCDERVTDPERNGTVWKWPPNSSGDACGRSIVIVCRGD